MKRTAARWAACVFLSLIAAGCDDALQPYAESDYLYSIMGYLDASADTQYIRIMPLRQTVAYGSAAPLDATVTLTNLDDGSSEVLRDSVFTHVPAVFLESADTTRSHNFWTTRKVVPGARYRLVVTRSDGATAVGTATIPKDYTVTMEYGNPRVIEVANVNLALVLRRAYTDCPPWTSYQYVFDQPIPIPSPVDGVYRVPLNVSIASPPGCVLPISFGGTAPGGWLVVASDIEWPAGGWNIGWAFPVQHRPASLTNATGFFAGVHSKKLPSADNCVLEPAVTPCRLTYFSTEATSIVGRVTDAACGQVVVGGMVRMKEIPNDPGAPARVETQATDSYAFKVLKPRTRYVLTASYPRLRTVITPFPAVYGSRVDTVFVETGQTLTHQMTLPRLVPCGLDTTTNPL